MFNLNRAGVFVRHMGAMACVAFIISGLSDQDIATQTHTLIVDGRDVQLHHMRMQVTN